MFWRERERESRDSSSSNGGPPCGQVRVLLVGDSGVGKTSLVHLIVNGSSVSRPSQTVGCTVNVKHTTYGSPGSSSNTIKGDAERDFFVELWDVSGHERYKDCRSLFYSQINGVIFVHDLSQRRTKASLQKWAAEVAATGTFSAPLGSAGPGGLPVPYIVIGNKADIAAKDPGGSSGNLVDVARHWVEKQGLLPSSEELPLTESFPGRGGLLAAAREARYDKEAVMKFFHVLIRRRYFSDEMHSSNPWSNTPASKLVHGSGEILSDDDHFYKTPREGGGMLRSFHLIVLGGRLCVMDGGFMTDKEIWVMKDYGVHSSWAKEYVFEQEFMLCNWRGHHQVVEMNNGELLMLNEKENLGYYDPKKKTFKTINICNLKNEKVELDTQFPIYLTGSLISPKSIGRQQIGSVTEGSEGGIWPKPALQHLLTITSYAHRIT